MPARSGITVGAFARTLTLASTLLLSVALIAAMVIAVNYVRHVRAAGAAIETQQMLSKVLSHVQAAETGQRGFLLTGRPIYLEPYERARAGLPPLLGQVRERLADDASESARLTALQGRIDDKLAELESTLSLKAKGEEEAALAIVQNDSGRQIMESIRTTIAEMNQAAVDAERRLQRDGRRLRLFLIPVAAVALLVVPFLAWRSSQDFRLSLKRTADRLEERRVEADRLGREAIARETELGGMRDRFELVLDSATDFAIIVLDSQGMVTRWSRGAEQLFGWSAAEAEGRPADLFFTPEDRQQAVAAKEIIAARDHGRATDERWHLKKDGTRFWASGEMQPIRAADGNLLGFLKIARDRTQERLTLEAERNRAGQLAARVDAQAQEIEGTRAQHQEQSRLRQAAESQVRHLQKLEGLGQLTAGIAHDFNNMLAVIVGAIELIRIKHARGDVGLLRLVAAAEEGANRAAELTRRLLAFSRQQPLSPQVTDLNRLVAGMSELLRRTIGEHIRMETVLAGGLWPVNADAHEIERVLLNLAVNARDAMPGGGRLTIETNNTHLDDEYAAEHDDVVAGQYVAICVTDTGSGMTPQVLAKAFDPFFSTKGVGKGTGLGLSQLYGFAKQSAGHAKIYSEVGHGTSVKLYLPRWLGAERPAVPRPLVSAGPDSLPRGKLREVILVVEDEERVSMVAVEALRDLGYTVRHAANGEQALALIEAQPGLTLLFTDVVMPGMTGRQLADRVTERNPEVKVLYTTGYTRNAVVHGGVIDPGVAFLPKPFTIEQLARKIRATIDGIGANR